MIMEIILLMKSSSRNTEQILILFTIFNYLLLYQSSLKLRVHQLQNHSTPPLVIPMYFSFLKKKIISLSKMQCKDSYSLFHSSLKNEPTSVKTWAGITHLLLTNGKNFLRSPIVSQGQHAKTVFL